MARVLGMLGSAAQGERDNAARTAEKLRCASGLSWSDIVAAPADSNEGVAAEAARILLAENEALRAEIEALRGCELDFEPVAPPALSHAKAAKWALDTHAAGVISLTDFEVTFLTTCARWRGVTFLTTCARWRGALTEKQGPIFQGIVENIQRRSRKRPPV
jgi:hypothetical protein